MALNPFKTALERYQQRTSMPFQEERRIASEIREIQASAKISDDPSQFLGTTDPLIQRLSDLESNRKAGAQKALLSKLTTLGSQSEMKTRINTQAASSSTYMQSLGPAQVNVPTGRLESRFEAQMGAISSRTSEMRGLSKDLDDPAVLKQYQMKVDQISRLEGAAALTKTTLHSQRAMGLDPRGIMGAAQGALGRIGGQAARFDLEQKAGAGSFGSLKDESSKLASMFSELQQATQNYIKASNEGTESQENAADKLKDITDSITKQEGVVGAIRRTGGGIGGGGTAAMVSQIANALGGVVGAGIKTYSTMAISQPLQIMENQQRFAGMYNRQYENAEAAAGGDMMALMKLGMMDPRRGRKTEQMFQRQQGVVKGQIAMDALFATGKIAAGVATGGAAGTVIGVSAASDIGNVMAGFSDVSMGVTASQTAARMSEQQEVLFESIKKIPAAQLQAYEGFQRGSYAASTGFGRRSSSMMNKLASRDFMMQAVEQNISPQELLDLTALGGQVVGGRDFQAQSIISGGQAEKAGVLSKSQYMNLLGSLTDVGGRNENMGEILKKSVAEGMDDSKNIIRMVSATASLAEGGSLQGINVTEGLAGMLSRGFGALGGSGGLTASQRTKMVASSAENLDRMYKMGGTDIFGLQEYSKIAKTFPQASWEQNVALEEAGNSTVTMFRTLLNADKGSNAYSQAMQSLERTGFGMLVKDANQEGGLDHGKIKSLLNVKVGTIMNRALGVGSTLGPESRQRVTDAMISGDVSGLNEQELSLARIAANRAGLGTLEGAAGMTRIEGGDATGSSLGTPGIRNLVQMKMSKEGKFQANKILSGETALSDLMAEQPFGIMQSDSAIADIEQAKKTKEFFFQQRKEEAIKKQTTMLDETTEHAGVGDDQRNKNIQQSLAPGSILKKSAGDFSKGVDSFGKAVVKFNELMGTMEKGADRGSEKSNVKVSMKKTAVSWGSMPAFSF